MAKLVFTSEKSKVLGIEVSHKMEDILEETKKRILKNGEVKEDRVNEYLLAEIQENVEEHKVKISYNNNQTISEFDVSAKELKNALKHIK